MVNDALMARSIQNQADLFERNSYEAAPRVIEFCLQTAGILELSKSDRIMVPHAIRRIDLSDSFDEPASTSLVAMARRSEKTENSDADENRIDIDAMGARGEFLMRVTGYATCPIPF
jgi:hypothetical protein